MNCPKGHKDTLVIDSRGRKNSVRRRRVCQTCSTKFNTLEVMISEYEKTESVMNAFEAVKGITKRGRASGRAP